MALFSIWEGDIIGISLGRGAGPHTCANGQVLDPDAVKVLEFHAANWNEACQRRNDYYGWGHYEPQPDWEEIGPEED